MNKQKADQIITDYFQKIYGFAVKKSFSYEEAEELCAEIVQAVYLSLRKCDEIFNPDGYIWRISEHTFSRYVSHRKKHEGISIDGMDIPFYDTYFFETSGEEYDRIRREIAYLTKRRRQIVYSFYYENKPISQIAAETGLSEGTVKWHLNKARHELKEGYSMERKIGKLGMSPVTALDIGHGGDPGRNGGPEYYLSDKLNLNIVYSVYHQPRTLEEIADELGVTPVYLEDRIQLLEGNGFLVRTSGNRYTTYVCFFPETYSLELFDKRLQMQYEAAKQLVSDYVSVVRAAVATISDLYIPGGNRELFEAAAVFYGIMNKCGLSMERDLSRYRIITTDGGDYNTYVVLNSQPADPD